MRYRIALCLLVVLSGCVAGGSGDAGTTTTPTTASPSEASENASGMSLTDCPYNLHVEGATETNLENIDRRVAYENLTAARQEEFDRALTNGTIELADSLPDVWGGPVIVDSQGKQYYAVASTC
jgi:PBP1b-binding outer membrane lipoprotein LpoB